MRLGAVSISGTSHPAIEADGALSYLATMPGADVFDFLLLDLEERDGVVESTRPCPPDARLVTPLRPNTIVVIGKSEPPRYAACVVLANMLLDVNRAVKQRLGTRKAPFASAEDIRALTGTESGGVTVFGLPPDLSVCVADGRLRTTVVVKLTRRCTVTLHASLLPRWRGAAPIVREILAGEFETDI